MNKLLRGLKALRELGLGQLSLYTLYQVGLRSGHYRRTTPARKDVNRSFTCSLHPVLYSPDPKHLIALLGDQGLAALQTEADEIVNGKYRQFGGQPVPITLTSPMPLRHWTEYESSLQEAGDLKFIWEPARFGWVFTLGRAYLLTQDERYPEAFWRNTEIFLSDNPQNLGPNWLSGQEVALRLCAMVFGAQVFKSSPHSTPARLAGLAGSVALHAERIPPTLVYARAQNNNHLISESVGLITASAALPEHPAASTWHRLGWRWLNQALQNQISPDGAYCQHSSNYHRLVLQAALWADAVQRVAYPMQPFPPLTLARLQAAVSWLYALLDPFSGQVPDLGPNDGANIFPLSGNPFNDYRPVLQAAARAFAGKPALPAGNWDEASLWFGLSLAEPSSNEPLNRMWLAHPHQTVLRGADGSWAYLRAARFTSRPGHADQLHLDLWWRGMNIALDPGTYRYTADPPWDNALAESFVHNTLSLDGRDQMTRAGRFLYLDWAQAHHLERTQAADGSWERLSACHDGYRNLGVIHQRQVTAFQESRWLVEDILSGKSHAIHRSRLHWLVPDWPWEVNLTSDGLQIWLTTPLKKITLSIQVSPSLTAECALVRSGQLVWGGIPAHPTWGWTSPTYGDKIPALAILMQAQAQLPLRFVSEWKLSNETI